MTLVQFPADRRVADVKRCAEALQMIHGEEANRFWRSEMVAFRAALVANGVEEAEIAFQARLFMQAVQVQLQDAYAEQAQGALA